MSSTLVRFALASMPMNTTESFGARSIALHTEDHEFAYFSQSVDGSEGEVINQRSHCTQVVMNDDRWQLGPTTCVTAEHSAVPQMGRRDRLISPQQKSILQKEDSPPMFAGYDVVKSVLMRTSHPRYIPANDNRISSHSTSSHTSNPPRHRRPAALMPEGSAFRSTMRHQAFRRP